MGAAPPPVVRKAASGGTKRAVEQASQADANRPRVFLDISVGTEPVGQIVCELYYDLVPRTAENFRLLCLGTKGLGEKGKPLHYKGCPFHRVVPNFALQGGDIVCGDGRSGESVYGATFEDEAFDLPHSSAGLLTMANSGPDTNNSQFFILTKPCHSLDRKHVVFGRVVSGMEAVRRVEALCGVADAATKGHLKAEGAGVVAFKPGDIGKAYIRDCGELDKADEPLTKRQRDSVHVFHMVKKHDGSRPPQTWQGTVATSTKGKAKLVVENVRKRLVGAANMQRAFGELAREHSDDIFAQGGGDVGVVEAGSLAANVEDVLYSLSKGELSEVFETEQGYHLVLRAS